MRGPLAPYRTMATGNLVQPADLTFSLSRPVFNKRRRQSPLSVFLHSFLPSSWHEFDADR